jgi:hypothetical protein
MRRKTLDALLTTGGVIVAIVLLVAGVLGLWAHSFVNHNVRTQLAQQKIDFPAKGSAGLKADPEITKYVTPYAGQQVLDGQQAEVFANHYIAVHLRGIGGGKTYSEVSSEYLAAAKTKPTDPTTVQLGQTRQTLFMGETLRGMLLNAYAFWKMGQIALIASIGAFVGAGLMLILSALGFLHLRRTSPEAEVRLGVQSPALVDAV